VRVGAYAYQRLTLVAKREGSPSKGQDFQPDLGNPAVRHDRGASENVATAELRTHLATERARLVTLRLQQAHPTSIPTRSLQLCSNAIVGHRGHFAKVANSQSK
jgi:hypothetical protein